jgi:hypothetical protein
MVAVTAPCSAQRETTSRIVGVSMFKNGLALIEREVRPDGPGNYRVTDIPTPVHGTFWFVGGADVSARIVMQDVKVAPKLGEINLQRDLAGRSITVFLRDVPAPITGRVRKFADPDTDTAPAVPNRYVSPSGGGGSSNYLVLDTPNGESFIDRSTIAHISAQGATETVTRRKPVLVMNIPDGENARAPIRVRYLAMGISWAPSYLVELLDDKKLRLRQKAIVRNELGPIANAELKLISGFPHIRFRHVTSPLSPTTSWNQFFAQINSRAQQQSSFASNSLSQQMVMPVSRGALPIDLGAAAAGEGVDLHYESIGRQSLGKGESLATPVASGLADYKRIVEWIVPDKRDANGRRVNQYQRNRNSGEYEDDPWDALQFRNPLDMPMTTGPATIMRGERFNGQTASYWVSRGEQTTLRVTKSLSIRTLAGENEKQGKRELVYIGGNDFQRVPVEGQLMVSNHRNEVVDMVIRRRFSGALIRADANPQLTLREEGVYSVNRRNELIWTIQLKPGEQRELKYEYSVLVDR